MPTEKSKKEATPSRSAASRSAPGRLGPHARDRILDAAARRVVESGPDGMRLAVIGRDLGVSHQTILHHFGSREGLLLALRERASRRVFARTVETSAPRESIEAVFDSYAESGQAKLLAWSFAVGGVSEVPVRGDMKRLADLLMRQRARPSETSGSSERRDVEFGLRLVATALLGEAILGEALTASASLGDADDTSRRFRGWLADLMEGAGILRAVADPRP
jgi:AcrR family transcriptional regulator